jgi:hypothetical protein
MHLIFKRLKKIPIQLMKLIGTRVRLLRAPETAT